MALGCAGIALLAIAVGVCRRVVLKWLALAAACALAVALAHGLWLGQTASVLDASGPRAWNALVVSDPRATMFGIDVMARLDGVAGSPAVRVSWPEGAPLPAYGQRVVLDTRLRASPRALDASRDAFRSAEILRASPWRVSVVGWAGWPVGGVWAWRASSIEALRAIGGRGAQALTSMLFGAPAEGEGAAALEDARTSGVAWAITASGLHLGILILLAERAAGAAGAGRRSRATAALVTLVVVSAAAGLRLSLLRAALAGAAAVLARLVGRRRDATAALGGALTILVIADPSAAYDAGLLLGAAAVSGIALLSVLAKAWLAPVIGRRASWALGGSVAAQVAVAPLAAAMFGAVSLLGPVTLAVSAAPVQVAVALGAAGALITPLSSVAGSALTRPGVLAAEVATRLWEMMARVPGALAAMAAPPWWFAGAWIGLGALLWLRWPMPRRVARVRLGVVFGIAAFLCLSLLRGPTVGCIEVLDVGQGDAILIRDGTHAVLVDTGPDPVVLRQALARAGVRDLDGLVLTHAHDDHIGGVDGLTGVARPDWIAVPDVEDAAVAALAARLEGSTDRVVRLRRGMEFVVGSVKVRVLWPRGGDVRLAANDTSVILLLERNGHFALLLGDAEEQAQRGALDAWSSPVEMLKVAHHGSVNGNVPEALELWRPRIALISVGQGNRFGHPVPAVVAGLGQIGAQVRRTDLEGDLVWEPAAAAALDAASPGATLCDNLARGWPSVALPMPRGRVDLWLPPVLPISSPSTSSTAPRSCSWSARRSASTIGSRPWRISISTTRPSMAPRPPPTPSSTPPTPCRFSVNGVS